MTRSKKDIHLTYTVVDGFGQLNEDEKSLITMAKKAAGLAYAPYSKFNVGASVLLNNGEMVSASNKENASFPAGICAERNVLNMISDQYPTLRVEAMAIHASPKEFEIDGVLAPCGICRQVICETEKVQDAPIKLIFNNSPESYIIVDGCENLLPFHFYISELKK